MGTTEAANEFFREKRRIAVGGDSLLAHLERSEQRGSPRLVSLPACADQGYHSLDYQSRRAVIVFFRNMILTMPEATLFSR